MSGPSLFVLAIMDSIWGLFCLVTQQLARSLLVVLLSLLTFAAYRLLFHPLARIPGPRLAAITNIWQARHVRNGHAREMGKGLHKKYGSIVRVGPNEVWFNSADAFKKIYSMSTSSRLI